ncbi:SDR family NAD(P)-dependent oxidoreductase [Shewanella algae]|uniref:SDR family NAD(P)-dependent oxidoreductase n=1 Tax=Shewanella algae TaxID=38313 RepID=UPI00271682D2|nr:3-oxoacyl-ACP reductase family protein [Shewanella algae]MDO8254234.1 3-oxoacyl-ACP reductase family protein [Shewanella algae]
MGRLAGKVALITGASRGIGAGLALAFAREGADIILNYRANDAAANSVAEQIQAMGRKVLKVKADVSQRDDIKAMLEESKKVFGRVDILVNNAGINQRGWFEEVTDEAWDLILGTNLKGPFICCQEIFPLMKANGGGRIINISSVAGQYHGPKTVHYAVSKAGLNSLTKILARYGAEHNILVNAVAPGLVRTDQTADEIDSPAGARVLDMTLLKKPGRIEDIASACIMLASDEQQYMTGQILAVSGGAILDN